MKFSCIISLAIAATVNGVTVPQEYLARFFQERETLMVELADWKDSLAGKTARENGFYTETNSIMSEGTENDHLERFFNSKLTAEEASRMNPRAVFGVKSPFTLLTNEEFDAFIARSSSKEDKISYISAPIGEKSIPVLPIVVDHVDHSIGNYSCVRPVQDSGRCAAGYAFAVVDAIQTAFCVATGKFGPALSIQEIVSCSPNSVYNYGCEGGQVEETYKYIHAQSSLCTAETYEYASHDTGNSEVRACKSKRKRCKSVPLKIERVTVGGSEAEFMRALIEHPISTHVAMYGRHWKQYEGGILDLCYDGHLVHAVQVVGYDETSFKMKNSWGTTWGENGFIRVGRIIKTNKAQQACGMINYSAMYINLKQ